MASTVWTEASILSVIGECSSKKQFRKRYPGAYNSIKRHGWSHLYDSLGSHLPNKSTVGSDNIKWSRTTIPALVEQCSTYSEFCKKYPRTYEKIKKKRWFDLLENLPHATRNKWTLQKLNDLISSSQSLYTFRQDHRSAYRYIISHKLYDLLDRLPRILPSADTLNWSLYRWLFPETHSVYIGISMNVTQRLKAELRDVHSSPVKHHIDTTGTSYQITILHEDLSGREAAQQEIATIQQYKDDGYNVLNRNRGGSLGSYNGSTEPYLQPSLSDLLSEAFTRYADYASFKQDTVLYNEIKRMHAIKHVEHTFFKQHVEQIVPLCSDLTEFRKKYPAEYHRIRQCGWTTMLSSLPYTSSPSYSADELRQLIADVNDNVITSKEAAHRLGIPLHIFYKESKGMLDKHRPRIRRSSLSPIPEWFPEALTSVIHGEMRQTDILAQHGINSTQFNTYAKRINPNWKEERLELQNNGYIESALLYSTIKDLREKDPNLYAQIKRHKLYRTVSDQMQKAHRPKLTDDDIKSAASKCTTWAQFMKEYPSEYQVVHKNHWEHLVSHLERTYKKTDEFTYEHIWDCAHSCSSRTEFNKKYHSESYAARKRGIYDEIVADMPKHTWRPQHHTPKPDYIKTDQS